MPVARRDGGGRDIHAACDMLAARQLAGGKGSRASLAIRRHRRNSDPPFILGRFGIATQTA